MLRKKQTANQIRFSIYLDDVRNRNFGRLARQLSLDLRSLIFGKKCPLCDCKTLYPLKKSSSLSFINQKICEGCRQDLDFIRGDEILITKVSKLTGILRDEIYQKLVDPDEK